MKSFTCGSINFQANYRSDIFITENAGLEFMRRLSSVVKMRLIKPDNRRIKKALLSRRKKQYSRRFDKQ